MAAFAGLIAGCKTATEDEPAVAERSDLAPAILSLDAPRGESPFRVTGDSRPDVAPPADGRR